VTGKRKPHGTKKSVKPRNYTWWSRITLTLTLRLFQ